MKRATIWPAWSRTAQPFTTRFEVVLLCLISLSMGMSGCEQISTRLGLRPPADRADEADVETTDTEITIETERDNRVVEPIESPRTFERTDPDAVNRSNQSDNATQSDPFIEPRTSATSNPSTTNPNLVRPEDQLILRNIIIGENGRSQIAVPDNWQQDYTLHPTAELQAYAPLDQLYFVALADTNFNSSSTTLNSRASRYLQQFINSLSSTEATIQTNVRQVGGYPAVQYQLQAALDGVPITYLHTTVETPFAYYQLLSWTERSQFPVYEDELQLVTQSFEPRNR